MIDIGCRIFRRNAKNIVVLWDSNLILDKSLLKNVFIVKDDGVELPLRYHSFKPMASDKFLPGTDGVVINHAVNTINPNEKITIKLLFGEGDASFDVIKEVRPAQDKVKKEDMEPERAIKVYGFDYSKGKWVPFPVDVDSFKIIR